MTARRVRELLPAWSRTLLGALRSGECRQDLRYELRRRRRGEPPLPAGPVRRVLMICFGNICRSPFAALDLAQRHPGIEVRSAGLSARDGKPAEPGALRVARRFGLELRDHAAHRLEARDVEWADLILGMQGRHRADVSRRWPQRADRVLLLGDFLPDEPYAIEDPWGRDDACFESVFERIVAANRRLSELIGGADA